MEATIYNKQGEAAGKMELPAQVFSARWNPDLVHQVIEGMRANQRKILAHVKDRGEVRGGGKKPWRQKGTGRARHGSIRSPLWRKGGVTHGPRKDKIFSVKINQKMKQAAMRSILAAKWRDGEVMLIDDLTVGGKTKEAFGALKSLSSVKGFDRLVFKKGNRALIALPSNSPLTVRSFNNLPQVAVREARNIGPQDLISYRYFLVSHPQQSLKLLMDRLAK